MRKALFYLIFMILICSQVFAITVSDLKPDDKVRDLTILIPSPFYKEEDLSTWVMQPFKSYEDVQANIYIYDSPRGDAPKGYDLMVAFEEWQTEAQSKERFEKGFRKVWECTIDFEGVRIKNCENPSKAPQLVYAFYYQNLFVRIQPHPGYPDLNQDLFYLSLDMKKLLNNILLKISDLEEKIPSEEKITPPRREITSESPVPAEKQSIPEEVQPSFFSKNKYYILAFIGLLIIFWMYRVRKALGVIFVLILGLIILNRYTVFTKGEIINLAILWVIIYFLVSRFYRKKIKKKKVVLNQKKKKVR